MKSTKKPIRNVWPTGDKWIVSVTVPGTNNEKVLGEFFDRESAHLFASALDLLAVLQAIVNGPVRISDKRDDMLSEHDTKVIAARAAIAKAKA